VRRFKFCSYSKVGVQLIINFVSLFLFYLRHINFDYMHPSHENQEQVQSFYFVVACGLREKGRNTGRKIYVSLGYVTVRQGGKMERAMGGARRLMHYRFPVPRLAGHRVCNGQRSSQISCVKYKCKTVSCDVGCMTDGEEVAA
jgi:hypothetical protein